MTVLDKKAVLRLIGEPYILEILEALNSGSNRFKDFSKCCKNERTRTNKLRKLEKVGLVEVKISREGGKVIINYLPTETGKKILGEIEKVKF